MHSVSRAVFEDFQRNIAEGNKDFREVVQCFLEVSYLRLEYCSKLFSSLDLRFCRKDNRKTAGRQKRYGQTFFRYIKSINIRKECL